MKSLQKCISVLLSLLLLATLFTACAPKTDEAASKGDESAKEESKADEKSDAGANAEKVPGKLAEGEQNKVALILEGSISDMSWNATAYEGLQKIEKLGAQVKYVENTPASGVSDAIRTFAESGFNVIFLSTNSYQDAGAKSAKEYPDVMFFMINSKVTETNVRSFAIQDAEHGYLMGALAALMSKSGKVAFVGGLEIPPILNGGKGFAQGVKDSKEGVEVLSQNTNSFDDVNAAKELASAFIGRGADVLAPMANQASLGVMEAAEEGKVMGIGSGKNQETVAPNAALVNIIKDTSIAYEAAYKSFLEGEMPMEILPMGVKQGVIYVDEYLGDKVPEEIQKQMVEIQEKLASGEITINLE